MSLNRNITDFLSGWESCHSPFLSFPSFLVCSLTITFQYLHKLPQRLLLNQITVHPLIFIHFFKKNWKCTRLNNFCANNLHNSVIFTDSKVKESCQKVLFVYCNWKQFISLWVILKNCLLQTDCFCCEKVRNRSSTVFTIFWHFRMCHFVALKTNIVPLSSTV